LPYNRSAALAVAAGAAGVAVLGVKAENPLEDDGVGFHVRLLTPDAGLLVGPQGLRSLSRAQAAGHVLGSAFGHSKSR
jgi:hypothetical protein